MIKGFFNVPPAKNEPVVDYAPGTPEREALQKKYKELYNGNIEVPMYIGGEEVKTGDTHELTPPHDHKHVIGKYHRGNKEHVQKAVDSALAAKSKWEKMSWEQRVSIFLKAADLISGPYRAEMNATTMLAQSKNAYQSEIDAVAEIIDFLRFNADYMTQLYREQPYSPKDTWNRMEFRPLEGFVFAITPFNFTAIAGNLPSAPAMAGNTVVWKPADSQIYSAQLIMRIFKEAGLPDGVINLIYVDGPDAGDVVFDHEDFAGLHFTGSTKVFKHLWKTIGSNIDKYKSYPRIVGETGGKDFIVAHPSAESKTQAIATAIIRGAFEFQGQKCSAASRCYFPSNLWPQLKEELLNDMKTLKMGSPDDFSNFVNAVIDRPAFDKISGYIDKAKESKDAEIIAGGNYDDSKGYFIEPTVILTTDPHFVTMEEEIFGPVVTIYVYDEKEKWSDVLKMVDETSPYALTGAVFSQDRYAIQEATEALTHSAGNFYINDKPTGSVVGQQPFGGARGSGTNDKAGAKLNMLRWMSARSIKENFVPVNDYRYPFLGQ
ncbi:MAG: L-glutamate gamma-semialdehyde dehydrogenase [Salibacter sp.]|uniref:L-glutamate gamma-semialdehyde dehydrogenase n=1 Tax=Salibacter sp. TaxID=2010995 RepID=UPI0028700473|nr:L-glutamate gamma-semialdehyde dehydrogenase [Salibacter sp.]MDR9398615.1 L-glutamate gamma-semialdehyde dehydrogenase [Salibacter sp.]